MPRTALHHARTVEEVREALRAGADANTQDKDGTTALMLAAEHGGAHAAAMIRLLIDAGADANKQDSLGTTALMVAVQQSVAPRATNGCTIASETLRALIAAGSDLDATDNHGNTALHLAALRNVSTDIVHELLDAGASMFVENNDGKTPADLFGFGCFVTLRHAPFRSPIFWSLAFAVASFVGGLLWGWIDSLLGLPGHPMWLWSLLFTCVGEGIIKAVERRSGIDFVLTPGSRFRLERFALLLVGFATFCWVLDTLVFGYTVFPTDAQPTGFSVLMHIYNSKFGKETLGLTSPFASARFVSVFTEFGLIATFLSPATLYLLARRNLEAEALKRLFAGFTILPPLLNLVGAFVATFIFAHRAYSAVESRGWQYVSPVEGPMMDLLNGIALPSFLTMFMALGIDAFRVASRSFVVGLSVFALVLAAWQSYFFGYEVPSNVAFEIRSSCDRNTMEAFMMKMAARATETEYVEPDADVWAGNANSFCLGLKAFSWSALIASGHNAYLMLMLAAAAVRLTDKEGAQLALVTENTRRAYLPAGRVAADGLPEAVSGADAAKVFLSICRRSRGGGEAPAAAADNRPRAPVADDAVHVAIDGEAAEVELEIRPDDAAARHPQRRGPWRREVDDESGQTQYYNTETRERRPECNANASLYARGVAPPRFNRSHCFGLFAQLAVLIVACFTFYVAVNEITRN